MDTKTFQGTLAEISVVKRLVQEEWDIFLPLNGKTRLDLVAHKENIGLVSIQVKSTTQKTEYGSYTIGLKSIRSNRTNNVQYKFNSSVQDIIAIYLVEIDAVLFILSKDITNTSSLNIKPLDAINKSEYTLESIIKSEGYLAGDASRDLKS